MCGCGCNTCETESTALVLNESKAPKTILSEGLKHHIDNNKPLTEHLYRAGSRAYFDLFSEARSLYSRGILEFTHEDDVALLTETDLGHFGMFEGKKVPLDFPMELTEDELDREKLDILKKILDTLKMQRQDGEDREEDLENLDISIDQLTGAVSGKSPIELGLDQALYGRFASLKNKEKNKLKESITNIIDEKTKKKKDPPIGKPMRSSSGGKAYKVYVRDPKTKKIKTVRFGSGGLKAKINNSKARAAFSKRHNCPQKKDRTKASYWSCRLPRYAKLLGLKSSFSGFW